MLHQAGTALRCDDISEYGRCCFLYSLLKPAEWYRNKGITGFWEVGGAPAPVPAESFKDVLMAPTLIGMFQAGKFLPPAQFGARAGVCRGC